MRHPTHLAAIALSVGLMGCDRPVATATEAATAAGTPAVVSLAAAPLVAAPSLVPVAGPVPVSQDSTQDRPIPPAGNNLGMIPRGQGPRPPQTLAEMQARNDQVFARLDANADRAITGDELAALSRGPQGARGGGRMREMIARADADGNSRITLEEIQSAAARRFARLDANGDGVVTDEERPDRP